MRRCRWPLWLFIAVVGQMPASIAAGTQAAEQLEATVPPSLQPWVDWVLEGEDRRSCPMGSGEAERFCAWPGRLQLALEPHGGRFEQAWELFAEAWVPLPGGAGAWPQQVSADGNALAVVEQDGAPAVRLQPGRHRVTGRFAWSRQPEVLAIPDATGLLTLSLDGAEVERPRRDERGRLWLGTGQRLASAESTEPDALVLDVVRRIDDGVPLRVQTRLALDVSGQSRELMLPGVALPGGIPLHLDSPLPARLVDQGEIDGERAWGLRIQLRPGRWRLTVESHHQGPVQALMLPERSAPWPESEVWAFAAEPNLRQVEVSGAALIDPRQTRVPDEWRRLPAYLMNQGDTLTLQQLRRGSPAADRLTLSRELRLDFGGDGFSVRDHIAGVLEQGWRLDALPELELGQVRVDGEPRMITRTNGDAGAGLEGVEVRAERIDLSADARIDAAPALWTATLPASGWDLSLDGIETRLHLPPGWDLLAVEGVDNLPNSWLARWSLLDIFLVLVIALGIGRLWGWRWGLLALVTLVLTWPEPGAPRWVWLHVLVAAALLQVLPKDQPGRVFSVLGVLMSLYYRAALLVLAVIALPFLVGEVRDGLFPQLERPGIVNATDSLVGMDPPFALEKALPAASPEPVARGRAPAPPPPEAPEQVARRLQALVPGALIQTGSGMPNWSWSRFDLTWSGPVAADQRFRLWLLPPVAVLPIALLQVVLMLALGLRLADRVRFRASKPGATEATAAAALIVAALLVPVPGAVAVADEDPGSEQNIEESGQLGSGVGSGSGNGFPSARLLDELRQRLLEPPDCLPQCVEISRMAVDAAADRLQLLLVVDAAVSAAVPLPGSADGWLPDTLSLNGEAFDAVTRADDGSLLAAVPAGRHLLLLSGPLSKAAQHEIPLPLRPRLVEARVEPLWQLQGVDADGLPGDQLRLRRQGPVGAEPEPPADGSSDVPPLLRITRTFELGLNWSLETRVERLSPDAMPISLWIPLIAGEVVTSAGVQVEDGRLLLSMPPGRRQVRWESALPAVDRLTLTAPEDSRLTEVWRVLTSPIWHLSWEGLPSVRRADGGRWPPTWRPWPGERLELLASRPEPVDGPTLTLDGSEYRLNPGRRVTEARLELRLRSSQGGRHVIRLPEGAELTRVGIDGQLRSLAMRGAELDLPLVPGDQAVEIGWRLPTGLEPLFRPQRVDLGVPGVNAKTQVQLGRDRWLLWASGAGIGPAVQFWGLILVLIAASAVLSRSRMTPLGFASWLLLGIGLSQAGIWAGALVVLWLFALGYRRRLGAETPALWFNLAQVGLVVLSVAALAALVSAVQQGLLGDPAMQVAGNGSSATQLNWYQDRQASETEPVTVVSVSIWVYRCLMLAWALWLAWRLLDWLRWGWNGFAEPSVWRKGKPRPQPRREAVKPGAAARGRADREGLTVDL